MIFFLSKTGPIPDVDELIKLIEETPLPTLETSLTQPKEESLAPALKKRKLESSSKAEGTEEEEEGFYFFFFFKRKLCVVSKMKFFFSSQKFLRQLLGLLFLQMIYLEKDKLQN